MQSVCLPIMPACDRSPKDKAAISSKLNWSNRLISAVNGFVIKGLPSPSWASS